MKRQNKISKTFRLDRSTVALLETYSREQNQTLTDTVELAIKRLCRESATPATQKDIEQLRQDLTIGFAGLKQQIEQAPVQILPAPTEQPKKKKWQFWR